MRDSIRTHWCVAAGLVVALMVRVSLMNLDLETPDTVRFLELANSVASGHGYRYQGVPETFLPPGYPMFLAGFLHFSSNLGVIRVAEIGISVLSCYLMYRAVRPAGERNALFALWLLATCPWVAQRAGIIHSENFGIFLTSALCAAVSWYQVSRRPVAFAAVGLLVTAIMLTTPAMAFVAVAVCLGLLWKARRSIAAYVCLAVGAAVIIIPWQAHCIWAIGRPVPQLLTVNDLVTRFLTPYESWVNSWYITEQDLRARWQQPHRNTFADLPPYAFRSPAERQQSERILTDYRAGKISIEQYQMYFGKLYEERLKEHPILNLIGYKLVRATLLWTNMVYPVCRARIQDVTALIGISEEDAGGEGSQADLTPFRIVKAIYSLAFVALYISYPIGFLAVTWKAFRRRDPIAVAILIGWVAYTIASVRLSQTECRRNLVLFPFMIFMLNYISVSSGNAGVPLTVAQAEPKQ